jgi:2-oxoglutarate/2-oxoacid ferredoxin oxidoreductase subunit alpha
MAQTHATQDRVNDFVIKLANVNGTGSASANTMLMKSIFRMGVPVMGKNYFPSTSRACPPGMKSASPGTRTSPVPVASTSWSR